MELKKHAPSASDNINALYYLIGFYAALAIFILIYNAILSQSGVVYDASLNQAYYDFHKLPPTMEEAETFLPPTPAPPKAEDVLEVPTIVDSITVIKKDSIIKEEVVNENVETGDSSKIEGNSGNNTSDGDGGDFDPKGIYFVVDKMPEYPGGDFALRKYIAENIKYPPVAHKNGIKGMVYVRFCVTYEGVVEKVEVVRGVNPILDQEALRVVQSLPKWAPGERKGKKVSVWYSVPINFQLN
jgi:periplasmic protein TonB